MNILEISEAEKELEVKYRLKWDSSTVYAKNMGSVVGGEQLFLVFELEMGWGESKGKILKQEYVLV